MAKELSGWKKSSTKIIQSEAQISQSTKKKEEKQDHLVGNTNIRRKVREEKGKHTDCPIRSKNLIRATVKNNCWTTNY